MLKNFPIPKGFVKLMVIGLVGNIIFFAAVIAAFAVALRWAIHS